MEAKTSRYKSRILREMHNSENPFNSPPSSTGSHGTVTLTSDVSYAPEGEGTRRGGMESDSIQLPGLKSYGRHASKGETPFKVNTSAIGRNFPGWTDWNATTREQTEDIYGTTSDHIEEAEENIPPSSSTMASPSQAKSQNQKHYKVGGGTLRTLAQMQPHVDVDDDPIRSPALNKMSSNSKPRGGNVTSLIQTLKAAQATKESTPRKSSPRPVNLRRSWLGNVTTSPATPNQTARSFFLPNLAHIDDFVSGALKLSSTSSSGIPVFVKHGKVHDRGLNNSPSQHVQVDSIGVSDEEQKIFVSLDKIREEIQALQNHDDHVSKQAEQLQEEVFELQIQMSKLKSRKDSAMGSDTDGSMVDHLNSQKTQLEEQVASLQSRLDKANRKISINEIHTESFVTERDEALRSATVQVEKIARLQSELDAARRELNAAGNGTSAGTQDVNAIETENRSLREENATLREQYKSLFGENKSLRSANAVLTQQNTDLQHEVKRLQRALDSLQGENEMLGKEYEITIEEKRTIKQDNLSLERQNDKYYNDNKSLQQKNTLLERRFNDVQDDNNRLHELLDAANAETGTVTFDMKDVKNRLEKRNRQLSDENVQLQQQIIGMQADFASKRNYLEQEKRRLVTSNDRLNDNIDLISKQFEQIVRETKEEAAKYEEKQSSLTQQLEDLKSVAVKTKPVKVTRIVEPEPEPTVTKNRTAFGGMSARSTTSHTDMQMQDDYTRQIDLTQDSDFAANLLPEREVNKLREALRQARKDTQQQDQTEEYFDEEPAITEDMSQSLPPPFVRNDSETTKSKVTTSKIQSEGSKTQPTGILKHALPPRQVPETELTGRFSVKSGMSEMSIPDQATRSDLFNGRRHSDSVRFDLGAQETSALFMDDITLESRKRAAQKEKAETSTFIKKSKGKAIPTLSKDAKRVLDRLCHDHDCRNCIVCKRINSHQHEDNTTKDINGKKTVRVEKPVPVTDRVPNPTNASAYEDQPTLRPARDPGVSLATVIKNVEDEEAHIKAALAKKNAEFSDLDPSYGKRAQRQLNMEISRLMRLLESKRAVIYALYDVLEGQKVSGQVMTEEDIDITIESIINKDVTWDGILD